MRIKSSVHSASECRDMGESRIDRKKVAEENHYLFGHRETMSRKDLKELQFKKTKEALERAY